MKPSNRQPQLEDFVSLREGLRTIDADAPEVILCWGEDTTDLLGRSVPVLGLLSPDEMHFAPYFPGCGNPNCEHCSPGSDSIALSILEELSMILDGLERSPVPRLVFFPFAESCLGKAADGRITAAVSDFIVRVDRLKRGTVPHKLILLTNSPWLLDYRLLESRRIDELLLVEKTVWREEESDRTLTSRLRHKVLELAVDGLISLLGQSETAGELGTLKPLIEHRVPDYVLISALANLLPRMPEKKQTKLRMSLTSEQRELLGLHLEEKEKKEKGVGRSSLSVDPGAITAAISRHWPSEEKEWLRSYFDYASALPDESLSRRNALEENTIGLSLRLSPESSEGKVFANFLNAYFRRETFSNENLERIFVRFVGSKPWRHALFFTPYIRSWTDGMIEELFNQTEDHTVFRLLWKCFCHYDVNSALISAEDYANYDRKVWWPRLLEWSLEAGGRRTRLATVVLVEIVTFTRESLLELLRTCGKSPQDLRHWESHKEAFLERGKNKDLVAKLLLETR